MKCPPLGPTEQSRSHISCVIWNLPIISIWDQHTIKKKSLPPVSSQGREIILSTRVSSKIYSQTGKFILVPSEAKIFQRNWGKCIKDDIESGRSRVAFQLNMLQSLKQIYSFLFLGTLLDFHTILLPKNSRTSKISRTQKGLTIRIHEKKESNV